MILTHRLLVLILISISAVTADTTVDTTESTNTTTSTNNVTTTTAPPANVTTAANTTSPPVSEPEDATNPQNTTTSTTGNATGNATVSPATTPGSLTTSANVTITSHTPPDNATATPNNATTPIITTLGNSTLTPLTTLGNSTTPHVTSSGNSTTTPGNATAPPQATCPDVPCPPLSVCVNSICQCVAGTLFVNNNCVETKTFPSSLRVNRTFEPEMNNPQSQAFRDTANEIIAALSKALTSQPKYINSTVIKLTAGSIVATVNSYFEPNSPVNQTSFKNAVEKAIQDCGDNCGILDKAEFIVTDLCDQKPAPCDMLTTTCKTTDGASVCSCKPGHVPNTYETRSCNACPSGQKAEGAVCVPCPFGYSGFNCKDSSLLALVVVSCVLGGILLIVILAVLINICVTQRRKPKDTFFSSPYTDEYHATWSNQGVTRIPRANLGSSSSNDATGSSLEMENRKNYSNGLSGSYDLNPEDMRTFKGANQSRYSYLVGHENPYFLAGDEKRTT